MQQFFDRESCTYTYVLADPQSAQGVIIDSVLAQSERDLRFLKEVGIRLTTILETHVHADHVTGAWELKQATGAKIGVGEPCQNADFLVQPDQEIAVGAFPLKVLATPGHTSGCRTYFCDGMLFTGDTLFIGGCGRTDFQQGSASQLFESVRNKLFEFPDETLVYPGHNYQGLEVSTIGQEKRFNPRLNLDVSVEKFTEIMDNLNLPYPKMIDQALPLNQQCGRTE